MTSTSRSRTLLLALLPLALLAVAVAVTVWPRARDPRPSARRPSDDSFGLPTGFDPKSLRARVDWRSRLLARGQLDDRARKSLARGAALFLRSFAPEDGLGPYFNDRSCATCHPGPLGRGPVGKAARLYVGPQPPDESKPATLSRMLPEETLPGYPPFPMPPDFILAGRRIPPSLRGLGWVEAIPGEQIRAQKHCDPQPGRATICGWVPERPEAPRGTRRFGSQFGVATLDEFIVGALQQEMGLTSTVTSFNNDVGRDGDPVPDPEIRDEQIVDLADFVAFSPAPGQPLPKSAEPGLARFREVGCAGCHWSSFTVEGTPAPQMYTDLLAHDLGPERADRRPVDLYAREYFRTTPLWGLRDVAGPFLHDGKAQTLEEAIELHAGEATAVREAWRALPAPAKAELIAMLKAL